MKKKKETPFLDFYMQHAHSGLMPHEGVCIVAHALVFGADMYNDLFTPSEDDLLEYKDEIYNHKSVGCYWGSCSRTSPRNFHFNAFRQTVVLFYAAINGELD